MSTNIRLESISDVPESSTIVTKNPTAADILDGNAAADGNDNTGGTERMDDRKPEDIPDVPTGFVSSIKSAWVYTAVTIIGIVIVIWLYRRK